MKLLLDKKIITAFASALVSLSFSSWLFWQIPEKQNTAKKVLAAGFNKHLSKPADASELVALIVELVPIA